MTTKELTDFYMWMIENDYDHNIRTRVEEKAKIYLTQISKEHEIVCTTNKCMACEVRIKKNEGLLFCGNCGL